MSGSAPKTTPVKSNTTTIQSLSPQQQELVNLAMPAIKDIAAKPPTLYPGSTVAAADPLQTAAQEQAMQIANTQFGAINNASQSAFDSLVQGGAFAPGSGTSTAINFLTDPKMLDPSTNSYLQAAIQAAVNPMISNFTESILPNIRGDAISSGQFGGSRQGVTENIAADRLTRNIGDVTSTMASNAYNTGLGALIQGAGLGTQAGMAQNQAMQSALNFSPQLMNNMLAPATVTGAVGDARQAQAQAQLTEEAMRFMAEQMIPFSVAQDIMGLAYGMPTGQTNVQSTGTQVTPGSSGGTGQAVATGLGAVASIAAIF